MANNQPEDLNELLNSIEFDTPPEPAQVSAAPVAPAFDDDALSFDFELPDVKAESIPQPQPVHAESVEDALEFAMPESAVPAAEAPTHSAPEEWEQTPEPSNRSVSKIVRPDPNEEPEWALEDNSHKIPLRERLKMQAAQRANPQAASNTAEQTVEQQQAQPQEASQPQMQHAQAQPQTPSAPQQPEVKAAPAAPKISTQNVTISVQPAAQAGAPAQPTPQQQPTAQPVQTTPAEPQQPTQATGSEQVAAATLLGAATTSAQPVQAPTQPATEPKQLAQAAEKANAAPTAEEMLRERPELHPLLEKMADESEKRNASDIFISSHFPPAFKIDGTLVPVPLKPLSEEEAARIVYSTFNSEQKKAFPTELELNYSVQAKNGIRFRVNAYHEQGRIGLVMRRITTDILTVDDLQLPQSLKDLAMRKRGLLILAGATGSGKSTSMAAMLDWRNKHSAGHIVTIEDPIEYIHKPIKSIITQREVGLDTHSWGVAVQSAMRQAPDVVCVGEVRNEHSMEYALQLAQTGHLCIFTIHATNASQTIERIMNLYPEERHPQVLMDLALNLVGVIGQRLVVKKGGKGRTAIVDLLINTPAMQDHVFKNELMEARQLMERAEGDGMQTFDQDLFRLYINGVIDYDEALRQAESVNDLRLRIKLYEEGRESEHIFERVGDLNLM